MDAKTLEAAGAIAMPNLGQYVVHHENLARVAHLCLENEQAVSIVGRTSDNPGAALIVAVAPAPGAKENAQQFFQAPPSRAGLSQALLDVIDRRS